MNKKIMTKCSLLAAILVVFAAVMFVLMHPAKNGRKTTEYLPVVSDSPVYVECGNGETVTAQLTMKQDMTISGLQILLVNISSDSRGDLYVTMQDSEENILFETTKPINEIAPGEWMVITGEATLLAGATYRIDFKAEGSEPFFMELSESQIQNLPFEEIVLKNGQAIDSKLSLGINQVTPIELKYGDIFYYSVPISVLAVIFGIVFVLFGKEKIVSLIKKVPIQSFLERFGNDLFILLLFAFSCMGIYAEGYIKGVYITSDSAGYLREAVNIANGNGFYYDGLAGYDHWFANWPIIYPLLIAGVICVTGTNAYLASKIVSMIMVGMILGAIRLFYKKDAWFYALCVWNLGFVTLTHYTWSEVPFIFFLVVFMMCFSNAVTSEVFKIKHYVWLGIAGLGCFLTRYFGIYIWIVAGLYILLYGYQYWKERSKVICLKKAIALTITAFSSGMLSVLYLLLNKIMNGRASGVSRTLWWDDYEILTNDLIQSLLTEVCNIFAIQIPDFVEAYPFNIKLLLVFVIMVLLGFFIVRSCTWQSTEGVMITFGICYYVIFIAIRYVSSMDTFYFRFFEPASFIICLGLFGLLLPYVKGKAYVKYFVTLVSAFLVLSMASRIQNAEFNEEDAYYHVLTAQWEDAYKEIPQKSVVIFSNLDYRSSYYRPDVIGGEIRPEQSYEEVCNIYAGSDYLCIKKSDAQLMLESGEYEATMAAKISEAVKELQDNQEYAIILLHFEDK